MKKQKYPFGLLFSLIISGVFFLAAPAAAQYEVSDSGAAQLVPMENIIIPQVPDELIADRLSCLQNDVKLTFNSKIRGFIDYFSVKNRKYTLVMERRKRLYFPIFEQALKEHNMPEEIKYLSIVESGLNPKAVSRAGAAGLWQFMPSTGRMYGLHQDAYVDERMDPHKATVAACKYLKDLYNMFGDWELALASYNCGPGYVRRAIKRSGYKNTFWEIYNYLPAETRSYVPQFVAVTYIMNHMEDHNIIADSLEYPMASDTLHINQYFNIEEFCAAMNICPEDMQKLNPALKRSYLPENYRYVLRIPADKTAVLAMNRPEIMDQSTKRSPQEDAVPVQLAVNNGGTKTSTQKVIYTVKSGDALSSIAARHGVTTAQIKAWNNMKSNTILKGQKLVIYKKVTTANYTAKTTTANQQIAQKPNTTTANNTGTKTTTTTTTVKKPQIYYVKPGDTLWTISKKYNNLPVDKIKKLNNLKGNDIKVGQKLIVG